MLIPPPPPLLAPPPLQLPLPVPVLRVAPLLLPSPAPATAPRLAVLDAVLASGRGSGRYGLRPCRPSPPLHFGAAGAAGSAAHCSGVLAVILSEWNGSPPVGRQRQYRRDQRRRMPEGTRERAASGAEGGDALDFGLLEGCIVTTSYCCLSAL